MSCCKDEPYIDSRGSCTPVLKDPLEIVSKKCEAVECGTKTIGSPIFILEVTNPENLLLQEDTGELIREDDGQFITVD